MSIFSSSKKKSSSQHTVLILDIGSSSVAGALTILGKNQKPHILTSVRLPIHLGEELVYERLEVMMLRTLEQVLQKLERRIVEFPTPEMVKVTLAGPWYMSQTREVIFGKKKPFKVTKNILDQLIHREIVEFTEREMNEHPHMAHDTLEVVERRVMHIRLNGYPVDKPLGAKANNIQMSLHISLVEQSLRDNLEHRIKRLFNVPITYHGFLFVSHIALKNILEHEDHHTIIDVGGEVTEIGVVRDDVLEETLSVPLGKNTLIRTLAEKFAVSANEARSLIAMYHRESMSKGSHEQLQQVIQDFKRESVTALMHSLTILASRTSLPHTILITAADDVLDIFTACFRDPKLGVLVSQDQHPTVLPMGRDFLSGLVLFEEGASFDPIVILETIFYNIEVRGEK